MAADSTDQRTVADEEAARLARIWTVPNVISIARLCCLPLFLYYLFALEHRAAAAGILAALGATDWIDGFIARRYDQVTTLGKVLDPVADKLLFFVGIGGIIVDGSVPLWFAAVALAREVAVAVGTLVLAAMGARRIDVTWFGKAGVFALMVAFPLFLASESTLGWADTARWSAWAWGIPGLVLSYYSALLYIPVGREALRDGRAAR